MENKKCWYAVMVDRDDNDWGTGSFDRREAERRMHEYNDCLEGNGLEREAYIAVIDADYDEDGKPTTDPICIDEITE